MNREIEDYGKLGENDYFEETLTKGDRGDRKKTGFRTSAMQAKKVFFAWRLLLNRDRS